jgi:hypothetical protein
MRTVFGQVAAERSSILLYLWAAHHMAKPRGTHEIKGVQTIIEKLGLVLRENGAKGRCW